MSIGLEQIVEQQRITNRLMVAFLQQMWPAKFSIVGISQMLEEAGATNEEIAKIAGTTPGTVQNSLSRKRTSSRQHEVLRTREGEQSDSNIGSGGNDECVLGVEQG